MKSIIEEASSIIKAIEKGWASAGKPTEFTVKVLEQPVYNFLGFNTKPAKISFFFDDRTITASIEKQNQARKGQEGQVRDTKNPRHDQPRQQSKQQDSRNQQVTADARAPRHEQARQQRPERTQAPERKTQPQQVRKLEGQQSSRNATTQRPIESREMGNAQQRTNGERAPHVTWSDDNVIMAKEWIQQFLHISHKNNIKFTTTVQNNILKVDFSDSITGNNKKEIMVFKNAAHLLMSSLRNATNSELKQLKVVFSTAQN